MIIGFTGKATAGKDTCARFARDAIEDGQSPSIHSNLAVTESFAGCLKSVCTEIWPGDRTFFTGDKGAEVKPGFTYRSLLQQVGVSIRQIDPNAWVDNVMHRVDELPESWVTLIPDCRFLNEAEAIKARGGVIVRVIRDLPELAGGIAGHVSETEMDQIEADYTIDNNGTLEETREQVLYILRELKLCAST